MEKYRELYNEWLNDPYFDEETKKELRAIENDENEIKERFYMDLEFGTGGLRGILGAGTNRMNVYIVRRATQGLANYIIKMGGQEKGVAIAYDSRHMSKEFSDEAARTLAANGIKAYRFESLRPTPELSFTVRELGCIAGINVTASHNPSNYNGYKVYFEDGAQITPPHDDGIMAEVLSINELSTCKTMPREAAEKAGLYINIGKEVDDKYISAVKSTIIDTEPIKKVAGELSIVYTPLHGTGHVPVMRILKELGFVHVYEVPEQAEPDGDFPTVGYPNPETAKVYELALKLAKEKNAELILATDPDADRLGIYAKDTKSGEYKAFTGNMTASLLCEYILSRRKELGLIPKDAMVVETIVSTKLVKAIAQNYGCDLRECLTGFKWIGREILRSENENDGTYMFGMEESYGSLVGTYARDKDAVSAVASLCEAAAYYKTKGKTLWDAMIDLYEKYGYYKEETKTFELKGIEGLRLISVIMEKLREEKPAEFAFAKVLKIRDYKLGKINDLCTGEESVTDLPKSNVLYYELNDNAWVCARPSGTEPKLKIYSGVKGNSFENAALLSEKLNDAITEKVNEIIKKEGK